MSRTVLLSLSSFVFVLFAQVAVDAQTKLVLLNSFSTSGGIGLAFDPLSETVWTYGSDTLRQYDLNGTLLNTISGIEGESANDADIDVAGESFVLGNTMIPQGTLLMTNGESGPAEVYGFDENGNLLATLNSNFGASHVVGSSYSNLRGTFFMVQDRVPSDILDNLVAEVNAQTGEVLNMFDLNVVVPDFTIFYGDLEVSNVTGHLLLVSTDESTVLEMSPNGVELGRWEIADGNGGTLSCSGIALDDANNEVYVQTTGGTVYRYAIMYEQPVFMPPSSFTVFRGITLGAPDLLTFGLSDDVTANFNPGFTINNQEAPVWIVFEGKAPEAVEFLVESNAGTPGLTMAVEAFDWDSMEYHLVGSEQEGFGTDQVRVFKITETHISEFGEARSRVGWRKTGLTLNYPWEVRIDRVGWIQ